MIFGMTAFVQRGDNCKAAGHGRAPSEAAPTAPLRIAAPFPTKP